MIKKILLSIWLLFAISILSHSEQLSIRDMSGGLVDKLSPDAIPDNACQDISNFFIDDSEDIGLVKRRGYTKDNSVYFGSAPVRNIYEYSKPSGEVFKIILSSNSIFYDSPSNVITASWSGNNETSVLTWLGEVFFINSAQPLTSWDGNGLTTYTGAPQGSLGIVYGNRLIISGLVGNNSVIYWSDINNAATWDLTYNVDYIGRADNDFITGLYVFNGNLYVLKRHAIYVILGEDPTNWTIRNVTNEFGCVDYRSIQIFNNYLYFLSHRGIEKFDGMGSLKVSDKIDNLVHKNTRQVNSYKSFYSINSSGDWGKGNYASTQIDTTTNPGFLQLPAPYFKTVATIDSGVNYTGVTADPLGNPHFVYHISNTLYYSSYTTSSDTLSPYALDTEQSITTTPRYEDIAIDSLGNPHICWYTHDRSLNDALRLYYSSFTPVKGWTNPKIPITADTSTSGWYCKIAIDSLNNPHIAYYDGSDYYIKYTSHTPTTIGSLGWTYHAIFKNGFSEQNQINIDIDKSSNTHIVWIDTAGNKMKYATSATSFTVVEPTSLVSAFAYPDIKVDSIGSPHISWIDSGNNYLYYSSKTATSWTNNAVDTINSYSNTNIVLDGQNRPCVVAFLTINFLKSFVFDYNYGWISSELVNIAYADYPEVYMDKSNVAHVIWRDTNNSNSLNYYQGGFAGVYISTPINIGSLWAGWSTFESELYPNGGSTLFFVRFGTSTTSLTNATWNSISNGDLITGTTPYIQYKIVNSVNRILSNPQIGNVSTSWWESSKFYPCASAIYIDRYWLSVSTINSTESNNTVIVMDGKNNFTKFQGIEAYCFGIYKNALYSGSALSDGWVYKQDVDDTYSDDGRPINAYWISKDYDMGDNNKEKSFQTIWTTIKNNGGTYSLDYALDSSTWNFINKASTTLLNDSELHIEKVNMPQNVRGRNIKFRVSNNDTYKINLRRIETNFIMENLR
jgi:hypothetical protein